MNSYEITLTNGTTGKEFTILAGNANAARAEALAHAARLTKENRDAVAGEPLRPGITGRPAREENNRKRP